MYAGELLEGRYDEWLADERERLAGLHADALERLAPPCRSTTRWPRPSAAPSGWPRWIRCARRATGC